MRALVLLYSFIVQATIIYCNTNSHYRYLGCFVDHIDSRDLDVYIGDYEQLTPELCIYECQKRSYKYAGLQYGKECRCGATFGVYSEVSDDECDYVCITSEKCGGDNRNSIYQNNAILDMSDAAPQCSNTAIGYQGCFNRLTLDIKMGVVNSIDECVLRCSSYYNYAGIMNGNVCHCGTDINQPSLNSVKCTIPCNTMSNDVTTDCCGGSNTLSIYDIKNYQPLSTDDASKSQVRVGDSTLLNLVTTPSVRVSSRATIIDQNTAVSTQSNISINNALSTARATSIQINPQLGNTSASLFVRTDGNSINTVSTTVATTIQANTTNSTSSPARTDGNLLNSVGITSMQQNTTTPSSVSPTRIGTELTAQPSNMVSSSTTTLLSTSSNMSIAITLPPANNSTGTVSTLLRTDSLTLGISNATQTSISINGSQVTSTLIVQTIIQGSSTTANRTIISPDSTQLPTNPATLSLVSNNASAFTSSPVASTQIMSVNNTATVPTVQMTPNTDSSRGTLSNIVLSSISGITQSIGQRITLQDSTTVPSLSQGTNTNSMMSTSTASTLTMTSMQPQTATGSSLTQANASQGTGMSVSASMASGTSQTYATNTLGIITSGTSSSIASAVTGATLLTGSTIRDMSIPTQMSSSPFSIQSAMTTGTNQRMDTSMVNTGSVMSTELFTGTSTFRSFTYTSGTSTSFLSLQTDTSQEASQTAMNTDSQLSTSSMSLTEEVTVYNNVSTQALSSTLPTLQTDTRETTEISISNTVMSNTTLSTMLNSLLTSYGETLDTNNTLPFTDYTDISTETQSSTQMNRHTDTTQINDSSILNTLTSTLTSIETATALLTSNSDVLVSSLSTDTNQEVNQTSTYTDIQLLTSSVTLMNDSISYTASTIETSETGSSSTSNTSQSTLTTTSMLTSSSELYTSPYDSSSAIPTNTETSETASSSQGMSNPTISEGTEFTRISSSYEQTEMSTNPSSISVETSPSTESRVTSNTVNFTLVEVSTTSTITDTETGISSTSSNIMTGPALTSSSPLTSSIGESSAISTLENLSHTSTILTPLSLLTSTISTLLVSASSVSSVNEITNPTFDTSAATHLSSIHAITTGVEEISTFLSSTTLSSSSSTDSSTSQSMPFTNIEQTSLLSVTPMNSTIVQGTATYQSVISTEGNRPTSISMMTNTTTVQTIPTTTSMMQTTAVLLTTSASQNSSNSSRFTTSATIIQTSVSTSISNTTITSPAIYQMFTVFKVLITDAFNPNNSNNVQTIRERLYDVINLGFRCQTNPSNPQCVLSSRRKRQTCSPNYIVNILGSIVTLTSSTQNPQKFRVNYNVINSCTNEMLSAASVKAAVDMILPAQRVLVFGREFEGDFVQSSSISPTDATPTNERNLWIIGAVLGPIAFVLLLIGLCCFLYRIWRSRGGNLTFAQAVYNVPKGSARASTYQSIPDDFSRQRAMPINNFHVLTQNDFSNDQNPSVHLNSAKSLHGIPQFPTTVDVPMHEVDYRNDVERWRNKLRLQEKFEQTYADPLTELDRLHTLPSSYRLTPSRQQNDHIYEFDHPNVPTQALNQIDRNEHPSLIQSKSDPFLNSEHDPTRVKLHRLLDNVLDKVEPTQSYDLKSESARQRRRKERRRILTTSRDPHNPLVITDNEDKFHTPMVPQLSERPDTAHLRHYFNPYEAGDNVYQLETANTFEMKPMRSLGDNDIESRYDYLSDRPNPSLFFDDSVLIERPRPRGHSNVGQTREVHTNVEPKRNSAGQRQHRFGENEVYIDTIPKNRDGSRMQVQNVWLENEENNDNPFDLNLSELNDDTANKNYHDEYMVAKQSVIDTKQAISSIQDQLHQVVSESPTDSFHM